MRMVLTSMILALLLIGNWVVVAQEKVTVAAATSEAAEGLDLRAVAELFKGSQNLEEFEKALNDPDEGINNLDLDENDEVDFIRVLEEVADGTRVIVLQAQLGENEFQDVATIEVEKAGADEYNIQVHGNEVIYGVDYYVAPPPVRIHTWPIVGWMYRPVYRPYRSAFYFGVYPRWWRPYRPVTVAVYRTRTVRLTSRTTFAVTRNRTVKTVAKVNYKPRTSTKVKKTTVTHSRTTTVHKGGAGSAKVTTKTTKTKTKTVKRKH